MDFSKEIDIPPETILQDNISPSQIVLFSTTNIDIVEINTYLKENGFPNLVKVNKIINVSEIPLLGSGKTDYKVLKGMILAK